MPVALRCLFGTMAEQRNVAGSTERLQKPQREFLPVVLDGAVARIDAAALGEFRAVAAAELGPGDVSGLEFPEQAFARAEIGHPHVVAARRQSTPAQPRRKDAQAVVAAIDWR